MLKCRRAMYLLHFLTWFIGESHCQGGFCYHRHPGGNFRHKGNCFGNDACGVPTNSYPSAGNSNLDQQPVVDYFSDIDLSNKSTLSLVTTRNYTSEGACLVVSPRETTFSITCKRFTYTTTTTITSSTSEEPETSTGHVTNPKPHVKPDNETEDPSVIIPVAAAISGLVCLVIVVLVIVFCKRRLAEKSGRSETSNPVVLKEEQPMYSTRDAQQNGHKSEHEYHYIEDENYDGRISTKYYESLQDSLVRKQFPTNLNEQEQHYDYSTCLSTSQKSVPAVVNERTMAMKSDDDSLQKTKLTVGENTYDSTNRATAEHFLGVNEYKHLSPIASRKKNVLDTYHTTCNVDGKKHEQEEDEDAFGYHVANLR